jgi:hypothetical protein
VRENIRGKKKGAMEQEIMGEEEAKHFFYQVIEAGNLCPNS